MRNLLAVAFMLGALSGTAWSASEPANSFAGVWQLESYTNADDHRTAQLTVRKSGDNYAVAIGFPPNATIPAGTVVPTWTTSKVMVKGNTLMFHADMDSKSDQGVVGLEYTLTLADGALAGEVRNGTTVRKLKGVR